MRRIVAVTSLAMVAALAGCAGAPPETATPAGGYPVFFQPWSASIDSNASSTIAIAAKAAQANLTLPIVVTGSADTVGPATSNKDLALARAQAVAEALEKDGVAASRIAVVSAGSISAPGTTSGSYAQFSRRVLIRVGE